MYIYISDDIFNDLEQLFRSAVQAGTTVRTLPMEPNANVSTTHPGTQVCQG